MTGSDTERTLVNALTATGWRAIRAPASGGGTDRDLPDVLAGRAHPDTQRNETWAIEVKTTHAHNCYVTESEDIALNKFAVGFGGATPLFAVKFSSRGQRRRIWLLDPDDCPITDDGHRALNKDGIEQRACKVVLPATPTHDAEVRDP